MPWINYDLESPLLTKNIRHAVIMCNKVLCLVNPEHMHMVERKPVRIFLSKELQRDPQGEIFLDHSPYVKTSRPVFWLGKPNTKCRIVIYASMLDQEDPSISWLTKVASIHYFGTKNMVKEC